MTDQALGNILASGAAAPAPAVDEPETLIADADQNRLGTEQVEGRPHPDEDRNARPKADAAGDDKPKQPAEVDAAFASQRKRYTEQVAAVERQLAAQNAAWERRFEELKALLPQQPAPDFFVDPQQAVQQQLQPFAHALAQLNQARLQDREIFSQQRAVDKHGADKVAEAEAWVSTLPPPTRQALGAHVMSSPHPYGTLVEAYERSREHDPQTLREQLKAEILAELGQSPQTGRSPTAPPQAAGSAVMPSNLADARNAGARAGPQWAGPPPLKDIFKRG